MNNPWALCALSALFYGGWPLLARLSGLSPAWVAATVGAGSLPVMLWFLWANFASAPTRGVVIGLIAGVICGLGTIVYSKLLSEPLWDISTFVPVTIAHITAVATIGGWFMFSEAMTFSKIAGILVLFIAIYLMA